jgi:DnaJ-class molecular chaperone
LKELPNVKNSAFVNGEGLQMKECERCGGTGIATLMPDGHEIECPACEGYGERQNIVDTTDELHQVLADALAKNSQPR